MIKVDCAGCGGGGKTGDGHRCPGCAGTGKVYVSADTPSPPSGKNTGCLAVFVLIGLGAALLSIA